MLDGLKRYLRRRSSPVIFNDLGRVKPASPIFGLERGTPIDRHYIEDFLSAHSKSIRGKSIEVGDDIYSRKFGQSGVETHTLLFGDGASSGTNAVRGDLTKPESLPDSVFDCFVCTQTLNFIFDTKSAVAGAAKLLKPSGVLLGTVSGISQISRYDMDRWGDYWRFTDLSIKKLLDPCFRSVESRTYGNALAASAFLQGLAVEDLPDKALLEEIDHDYQLLIAFKAVK